MTRMGTDDYRIDIDTEQGVRGTGFYNSKKWLKVRDAVRLRDKMTCRHCGMPILGRYVVDHIKPVTLDNVHDWEVAYNMDNLQLLCLSCHNTKTFYKQTYAKSRW